MYRHHLLRLESRLARAQAVVGSHRPQPLLSYHQPQTHRRLRRDQQVQRNLEIHWIFKLVRIGLEQKWVFIQPANMSQIAATDLAHALDVLDVPFIAGGSDLTTQQMPQPGVLLASLAASNEARLRLAVIPLLLCHPEFTLHVRAALRQMTPPVQTGFKCYYTAAVLLQQKYRERLNALMGDAETLPDLFSVELGVPGCSNPDDGLSALADRHKTLTGRLINWQGTYEHGAQRLLRTLEGRKQRQT